MSMRWRLLSGMAGKHPLCLFLLLMLTAPSRDSYAVVDREGRVISVLAGTPRDPNWGALMKELGEAVGKAREEMTFSKKQKEHVRGTFPSVSVGTSFGGGSKVRWLHESLSLC